MIIVIIRLYGDVKSNHSHIHFLDSYYAAYEWSLCHFGTYITLELWTNLNYQTYSGMGLLNNRRLVFSL